MDGRGIYGKLMALPFYFIIKEAGMEVQKKDYTFFGEK